MKAVNSQADFAEAEPHRIGLSWKNSAQIPPFGG
jgi:hypothetical protein